MLQLNFRLSVKFRVFRFTLGTFEQFGWLGLNADTRRVSWGLETGQSAPTDARSVVDRNGVLLQVWA